MTTKLIVTVDTEEEGLWGGKYRSTGNTVENIQQIPRFQELCKEFAVRPTYLIDAPVVTDQSAVRILKRIHEAGECEIGAHVHPWCNPPFSSAHDQETYLCNYPQEIQQTKIEWLTQQISERIGERPVSFRAGRYGMNADGLKILDELGYLVDSSVIPYTNYASQSGPDFSTAPVIPYYPDVNDICRSGPDRTLLEVPVTVGYSRGGFAAGYHWEQRFHQPLGRALHLEGIASRLGILSRIKLSPEQSTAKDMCRLIDRCIELQIPSAVMMFHSSSLMAGASPYTTHAAALDEFIDRIRKVLIHVVNRRGMQVVTLAEFAREFKARSMSTPQTTQGVKL